MKRTPAAACLAVPLWSEHRATAFASAALASATLTATLTTTTLAVSALAATTSEPSAALATAVAAAEPATAHGAQRRNGLDAGCEGWLYRPTGRLRMRRCTLS